MKTEPVLFAQEAPARAACVARNRLGGFYRVRDLTRDPLPDLEGETGFLVEWDREAADAWRHSLLPDHQRKEPRAQPVIQRRAA